MLAYSLYSLSSEVVLSSEGIQRGGKVSEVIFLGIGVMRRGAVMRGHAGFFGTNNPA